MASRGCGCGEGSTIPASAIVYDWGVPLQANNLTFAYRAGRPVVNSVSFALEPGTVMGVVGPNGAGKSTLVRLLLGSLTPVSGSVLLDGVTVASMPHRARAKRIAYVPQRPAVAFAFTVREYVGLGRYALGGAPGADAVDSALRRVDLRERADDPFPILSVGQQQRAALARALAQLDHGPGGGRGTVLLADEPVSAMDPRHALQTMAILRGLAGGGTAVAVVLHDVTLALRSCDRAVVLDEAGRLAAAGPAEQTLTPSVLDPVFAVRFTFVGDGGALIPALP